MKNENNQPQHTPGNILAEGTCLYVLQPNNKKALKSYLCQISSTQSGNTQRTPEEALMYAVLFAAAPEMLEFIQMIAGMDRNMPEGRKRGLSKRARAVLAKAEGRGK